MNKNIDLIIVGFGLAGANLALAADRAGLKIAVIQQSLPGEASIHSAGLINPVTGRKLTLSWKFPQLLQTAKEVYNHWGKRWNHELLVPLKFYRRVRNAQESNLWLSKSGDSVYRDYLSEDLCTLNYYDTDFPECGEIRQVHRLNVRRFLSEAQTWIKSRQIWVDEEWHLEDTQLNANHIKYIGLTAKALALCTGHALKDFPGVPIIPSKGEILLTQSRYDFGIKAGHLHIPLEDGSLWVGSNYENNPKDVRPNPHEFTKILNDVKEIGLLSGQKYRHLTGIRPTIPDRRPVVGTLSSDYPIYILNGLGAKGASLSPFCARMLLKHIVSKTPVIPELDIKRYLKS